MLVAGGSAGLGLAAARECARRGAKQLILLARRVDRLEDAAAAIRLAYPDTKVATRSADVRDATQVEVLADEIRGKYGVPDILIYSAAGGHLKSIDEENAENIRMHLESTYYGAYYLVAQFIKEFIWRNSGHIVIVHSPAFELPYGMVGYVCSRAALATFAKALQADLFDTRIGVTLAEPGALYPNGTAYFTDYPGSLERLPFANLPNPFKRLITYHAEHIARKIASAIEANRFHYIPFMISAAVWFANTPLRGMYARLLRLFSVPYEQGGPISGHRRRLGLMQKAAPP